VLDLLDFCVERETDLPATVLFRQYHGETSGILEDDDEYEYLSKEAPVAPVTFRCYDGNTQAEEPRA
jgi:hypothetical protein